MIRRVNDQRQQNPGDTLAAFSEIGALAIKAAAAIEAQDGEQLGALASRGHALMQEVGVSNETLDEIVRCLEDDPHVTGAKISGAGLGDCVVGMGCAGDWVAPYRRIPVNIDEEGLRLE